MEPEVADLNKRLDETYIDQEPISIIFSIRNGKFAREIKKKRPPNIEGKRIHWEETSKQ